MGAVPFTDNDSRIFFGLPELSVGIAPFLRYFIAPERLHTFTGANRVYARCPDRDMKSKGGAKGLVASVAVSRFGCHYRRSDCRRVERSSFRLHSRPRSANSQ